MHKDLIDSMMNDFKSFFTTPNDAEIIKYQMKKNISGGMKVLRTGKKTHIAISEDIKYLSIEDDISKLYILFMLGHELAHLVNRHLEHSDDRSFDSRSLEMWADFFGAKIAMTILKNGSHFIKLLDSDFSDANKGLEDLFKTILLLKDRVFVNTNNSRKYLKSNDRVATTVAGIMAYLTRSEMAVTGKLSHDNHTEMAYEWGTIVNTKMYELGYLDTLYDIDDRDREEEVSQLAQNAFSIHNKLKEKNTSLVKGLKYPHFFVLDTIYGEHKPNQDLIDMYNTKFKQWGWESKL